VMTNETEKLLMAGMLAREKMVEVQLIVESDGFGEADIEEEGDFTDFGTEDGLSLGLDISDEYEDFQWAYTIRKIELTLGGLEGGDMTGMADNLAGQGYWGEQSDEVSSSQDAQQQTPGLDEMGVSSDMITDMLGNYIREVRVLVWWGENEDELDQVEIVSHVINPSGISFGGTTSSSGSSSGTGSTGTDSTGKGSSGKSGGSSNKGTIPASPGDFGAPSIPGAKW